MIARELAQKLDNSSGCLGIKVTRWLVGKNNAGVFDDCSCNGYTLTLTTTELRRITVLITGKPYPCKCHTNVAIILHSTQIKRKDNIIVNRQLFNKVVILKDKSNMRVAIVTHFFLVEMRNIIAVNLDSTACDFIQAAYEVEKCGFTTAALTKNKNKTCIGQGQVNIIECVTFFVFFGTVNFTQRCNFDHTSSPTF